ncbi:hypothetical protein [Metabacillus malikii]|uniref:Uncharacterized protein n=1 Tax=Metabacillus malikii TaxID=1504265 RepID=A0ABT9ZMJ4_9BACI|nr:hypothetical protein [Metabacillus malikii]MDQ0233503.1 hypothetical protein [Metabacillus malikii]
MGNYHHYQQCHSTIEFLNGLSIGQFVRVQFDGGGAFGVWEGTYQGTDQNGNVMFYNLFNPATNTTLTGVTRIKVQSINSITTN